MYSVQSGVIWSVAFSPDDRMLAFASGSNIKGSGGLTILRGVKNDTITRQPLYPPASKQELAITIPPRAQSAPPHLLNLSAQLNASLRNNWRRLGHDIVQLECDPRALGEHRRVVAPARLPSSSRPCSSRRRLRSRRERRTRSRASASVTATAAASTGSVRAGSSARPNALVRVQRPIPAGR